jgi:hypothetical protein
VAKISVQYINPEAPRITRPTYSGHYYESLVPATLDLAERARLCVNALTETTDPDYDDELYWIVDLLAEKPAMYHTLDDHVQAKFLQALPLVRTACGSRQNLDAEARLLRTYLKMQGRDGLIYTPVKGRPWALPPGKVEFAGLDDLPEGEHWCSVAMNGRVLGAFCVYALEDSSGPWREAALRLADGLMGLCIVEDDIAYLFNNCTEPGLPITRPKARPVGIRAALAGWVAQGLAQCCRSLDYTEAGEMAARLMRYIMRDSGYFLEDGEFTQESPDLKLSHFHAHTCQILGALEVVQATGDSELLELARRAYSYALGEGEPLVGFFPEWLGGGDHSRFTSEICEVADMIACALKLCNLGFDEWDNVDRWLRNQFAECQLTDTVWVKRLEKVDREKVKLPPAGSGGTEYGTTDHVVERVVGSFAGWPSANDFVQGTGWTIMHCCTGNGARSLYYLWESILAWEDGRLRVNLLLNRASRWVDLHSHLPYRGQVDLKVKEDLELEVRLPEWVRTEDAQCTLNGSRRELTFEGRYAQAGRLGRGDEASFVFPIPEREHRVTIQREEYTLVRRGNEVVSIDPPGKNCPLYQREHMREGKTPWTRVLRFVPEREIPWR